jgi:hypothetical protein
MPDDTPEQVANVLRGTTSGCVVPVTSVARARMV